MREVWESNQCSRCKWLSISMQQLLGNNRTQQMHSRESTMPSSIQSKRSQCTLGIAQVIDTIRVTLLLSEPPGNQEWVWRRETWHGCADRLLGAIEPEEVKGCLCLPKWGEAISDNPQQKRRVQRVLRSHRRRDPHWEQLHSWHHFWSLAKRVRL